MMKHIHYFILFLAAAFCSASCEDSGKGAGDATIGFEKDTYTFLESEGTVKVPVVFTGEPEEYPIVFSISASVDGDVDIDDVAHFVQILSSLRYNGNGDVVLEIELQDNFEPNPARNLTLEIISADGAEIVNGRTTLVIEDNDGDLYQSLQGEWTFNSTIVGDDLIVANGTPHSFKVKIDAGETESEIAENTQNRRLRVLGWEGFTTTTDGYDRPFEWYLDIKYEESLGMDVLWTVPEIPLVDTPGNALENMPYSPCTFMFYAGPVVDGVLGTDVSPTALPAEVSEDMQTITFVTSMWLTPLVFSNGMFKNLLYNRHANITLTR